MSTFIFKGRLCGFLCADVSEPLAQMKVRLYRPRKDQDVTALAVANPKETLALLSDGDVEAKAQSLLAEVETDAEGRFSFELGEQQGYRGEAVEIDLYCGTVPRRIPTRNPPQPRQLSLTTVQPRWRQREELFLAAWDYCIPHRFWCFLRGLFGAWTICGKVVTCDQTATPIANVKVSAFDADWLQHDRLGSAMTDGGGRFRIDYSTDTFQKTPFSPSINVELTGGPDVYFKIETSDGLLLLGEPRARGRKPDRENRGPCFCTTLCVDANLPGPDNPLFTHVGDFHIYADIDAASGLTNSAVLGHAGAGFGFYGAPKLRGYCPKQIGGRPARYRFLYEDLAAPGTLRPITAALVADVLVGARRIDWNIFGTGLISTFQSIVVGPVGSPPGPTAPPPRPIWGPPPSHVIAPDEAGWITVDQGSLDGGFFGPLLRFDTTRVFPTAQAPGNGAGHPVPVASQRNGADLRIVFEAGPVESPATISNSLGRIHVNNWLEVKELALTEFAGAGMGCSRIKEKITLHYTVDHELTESWELKVTSAASIPTPVLASGSGPRGVFTGPSPLVVDVSAWQSCAYTVTLGVNLRRTDGETDDPGRATQLAFCK
jgi:hypothetical protein